MKLSRSILPILAVVSAAFIWGLSGPVIKLVLVQIPPFSLIFMRFTIAVALIVPISFLTKKRIMIKKADWGNFIALGFMAVVGNIGFAVLALKYTTALDFAVFNALTPVLIALAGVIFLKEILTKLNIFGQELAIVGVLVVVGNPNGFVVNRPLGDALLLIASLCWVGSFILAKNIFRKYSSFTVTYFLFLFGFISFAPLAVFEYWRNPNWVRGVSETHWIAVIFLGIFTSVIAYLAFEWGLKRSLASTAGLAQYIQFIVGVIFAILLLNEFINWWFVLGVSMILIGMGLATRLPHFYFHRHH